MLLNVKSVFHFDDSMAVLDDVLRQVHFSETVNDLHVEFFRIYFLFLCWFHLQVYVSPAVTQVKCVLST